MTRGKSLILAFGLGALLTGCDSEEQAALAERQRQLDAALAERQEIAQHLNEIRHKEDALAQQVAELRARMRHADAAELARLLAGEGLKELSTREEVGTLQVRLGGDGGASKALAALSALEPAAASIVLRGVTIDAKGWSAELEVPPDPKPAPPPRSERSPGLPSGPPLPERGLFSGSESRHLREQIAVTERRIMELDKVLGEVNRLAQQGKALEAELGALRAIKLSERLAGMLPVVERLFGGPRPVISQGTVRFTGTRLTLSGLGSDTDAAKRLVALSEVGKVVESGKERIELELATSSAASP